MSDENANNEQNTTGLNLQDLWTVVLKRKWIVISFALVVVAAVTIASFLQKPTYTSNGMLLIEEEPNILTFEKIYQMNTYTTDYYETQYKILTSRTLAKNTIEQLKLNENEKFAGKLKKKSTRSDQPDSIFMEKLIDLLLKRIIVRPVTNRLVEVSFKDENPKFAAQALDTLLDAFIDMNIQKKFLATEQATEFLAKQIANVNAEIEGKEKKLQEYGAEKNIVILNDKETTMIEKLKGLNQALTDAEIDRIKKETYYNEIKFVSPNDIPESLTNELIVKLREEYARLNREFIKKSEIFKADFPEMQRLKVELDSVRESLNNETQNLIKAAYADFQAALNREKSLKDAFNKQNQEAIKLNNNAILYNSLEVQITNKKSVLDSLLKRQAETDVSLRLKGLKSSNVSILDRASIPVNPSSPKKKRNMILALMVGLFGGLGLAFLFEVQDKSIKNIRDLEKYSKLPALGIIPAFSLNGFRKIYDKEQLKKGKEAEPPGVPKFAGRKEEEVPKIESIELITHFLPKSKISENYRSIRTSLLLTSSDSKLKTLAISSPLPQEGKTATISNLAVTFAQTGKTVLVIDSDLRKPTQHKIFKVKNQNGLTNFLSGNIEGDDLVKKTQVPNLYLINSGPAPTNPLELLSSEKMANLIDSLKKHFEYILIDTPPLLLLSDAFVLGPKIDGMILVVWGGKTSRDSLRQVEEKLDSYKIRCPGVIINGADLREHDYYYMKQYNHYYEY